MNSIEKMNDIYLHMKNIGSVNPDWMKVFQNFMQSSKKEGALSSKFKELMGIALSINSQCERCIIWHVKNALDLGATKEEIFETCLVAVVMGGGPSLMYMEDVLKAVDDFTSKEGEL